METFIQGEHCVNAKSESRIMLLQAKKHQRSSINPQNLRRSLEKMLFIASGGTSPANTLVVHFQPPDGETIQLCCLSCPFLDALTQSAS